MLIVVKAKEEIEVKEEEEEMRVKLSRVTKAVKGELEKAAPGG